MRKRIFMMFVKYIHAVACWTRKDYFFSTTFFIAKNRVFNAFIKSFDETSKLSNIEINPFILVKSGFPGNHYYFTYDYTCIGDHRAPWFNNDLREFISKVL